MTESLNSKERERETKDLYCMNFDIKIKWVFTRLLNMKFITYDFFELTKFIEDHPILISQKKEEIL